MFAIWINALTVLVGGIIGTALRGGIPARIRLTLEQGLALCVMVIGISGAIKTQDMMGVIVSIVIGALIGEALRIDDGLIRLGEWAQAHFSKGDSSFSQGFVSATLLFSVGALAVVGSLEAGISGKADTLLAKSAIDGVTAAIFASTMGPGVILSLVPLTLYQGGIALASGFIAPILSTAMVTELSAVGSLIIIGLSLNMLGIMRERIKVANLLPAMLVIFAYRPVAVWIAGWFGA